MACLSLARALCAGKFVTKSGQIRALITRAYYIPSLEHRLLSPQDYFREDGPSPDDSFHIYSKHSRWTFEDGEQMIVEYDPITRLPLISAFADVNKTAEQLALACDDSVLQETNQNITDAQKTLLRWHFRLGHASMKIVKWLAVSGFLGTTPAGLEHADFPMCASCQFGKGHRASTPGKTQSVDTAVDGALSDNVLEPGQRVAMDQYVTSQKGRLEHTRGQQPGSAKYVGGTLFVDIATRKILIRHQSSLTALETIKSKHMFERMPRSEGVLIQNYISDNGVFTAKEFMLELEKADQGLRLSGVGGHHSNGTAERAIRNVTEKARTILLHAMLHWPVTTTMDLWPMTLSHAVHLYNATPRVDCRLSPNELFSKTLSNHHDLLHSHPWGCPVYVLHPALQAGKKLPRWQPRTRRGMYMGRSPSYASTVALVLNLNTSNISPQFHVVLDDWFETVSANEDTPPENWDDLIFGSRYATAFDDDTHIELQDEWLDPTELADKRQRQLNRIRKGQHNTSRTAVQQPAPAPVPPRQQREPLPQPEPPPAAEGELVDIPPAVSQVDVVSPPAVDPLPPRLPPPSPRAPPPREHPPIPTPNATAPNEPFRQTRTRQIKKPIIFDPSNKETFLAEYRTATGTVCGGLFLSNLYACIRNDRTNDALYYSALDFDPELGVMDHVSPSLSPYAFKATPGGDPDSPRLREAMLGPHSESFQAAMEKEIEELVEHDTWENMYRSDLPEGAKVLKGTWVFKIKRFPDGLIRKFKARFCVRGDMQIDGVDVFETYAPVVSWSTARALLAFSLQHGLETRQVDFSNAFCHASMPAGEDVYVELSDRFKPFDDNGHPIDPKHCVMKLKKSLYEKKTAPLLWFQALTAALEKQGFTQCDVEPCMFTKGDIICLVYVDDCLFFAKDKTRIDAEIDALRNDNFTLTVEKDLYAFLGINVATELDTNGNVSRITLSQPGLIQKILAATDLTNCNTRDTPASETPLGADTNGPRFDESYDYGSVVGMLMYLTHTRPEIQFAVHQVARFTHSPRQSHARAITRICRYIKGTDKQGLQFTPSPQELQMVCYVDAEFAGLFGVEHPDDPAFAKSRAGYVVFLGNCPVVWVSKLMHEICLSTTESEYVALSMAMRKLIPLRRVVGKFAETLGATHLLTTLHGNVYEDNNTCISQALSPRLTPRNRHYATKLHFFKQHLDTPEQVVKGSTSGITLKKIETAEQIADIFTKGLVGDIFAKLRKKLMGW